MNRCLIWNKRVYTRFLGCPRPGISHLLTLLGRNEDLCDKCRVRYQGQPITVVEVYVFRQVMVYNLCRRPKICSRNGQ